jgi:hypothetical protein
MRHRYYRDVRGHGRDHPASPHSDRFARCPLSVGDAAGSRPVEHRDSGFIEYGGKNYRVYSDARRVELDHVPVGAGAMGARVVETEVYRKNVR